MAGGSEWIHRGDREEGDAYQKVANGPWFMRKRVIVTISRKVKAENVSFLKREYGTTSGMLSFTLGRRFHTIALSGGNKFVCRSDGHDTQDPQGAYTTQVQEWVYESGTEEQVT